MQLVQREDEDFEKIRKLLVGESKQSTLATSSFFKNLQGLPRERFDEIIDSLIEGEYDYTEAAKYAKNIKKIIAVRGTIEEFYTNAPVPKENQVQFSDEELMPFIGNIKLKKNEKFPPFQELPKTLRDILEDLKSEPKETVPETCQKFTLGNNSAYLIQGDVLNAVKILDNLNLQKHFSKLFFFI